MSHTTWYPPDLHLLFDCNDKPTSIVCQSPEREISSIHRLLVISLIRSLILIRTHLDRLENCPSQRHDTFKKRYGGNCGIPGANDHGSSNCCLYASLFNARILYMYGYYGVVKDD